MEILCFFAGIAFFYIKSIYALFLLLAVLIIRLRWQFILWFLAGISWAFIHQYLVSAKNMPVDRVIQKATITGKISSIPSVSLAKTQFYFQADKLNQQKVKATILLSCYNHCPSFKAGQFWQFTVKLKQPANLANPGSFDYVSTLKARHIFWTGYIKSGATNLLERDINQLSLLSLREHLAQGLEGMIAPGANLAIVEALTLGLTSALDTSLWDLFRRTGTTHLMVISGAHIGLIAGIIFWFSKKLWSRSSRLTLHFPAPKVASIASFLMAFGYALLAGFAVPAQRALLACLFMSFRYFLNQRITTWQSWRYALLLVLVFEPHAVLLPGFYLSFLAVATLILSSQRLTCSGFKKTIYLQIACLLGLMPLSLYWFSYGAINGFLANLVAIPWVGFVIVPLALLSMFLIQLIESPGLVIPLNLAIDCLLRYLHWVDSFAAININFTFINLVAPLALMLAMIILLLLPLRALYSAVFILLLSCFIPFYPRVNQGDLQIRVLDVGQGLAVVIKTAEHVLVYDTGVKFYQGGDMGKLVLVPYLRTLGIKKIDKVIISHPDLDHRGGLPSLEAAYPIDELLVDKPSYYHRGKPCHESPAWQWDGISFRFLAIAQEFRDKNNSSCVLQIKSPTGSVLLTGDIERLAEDYLVNTYGRELRSDILLIPHHGSKTSSSSDFIKQVAAGYALISFGFDNRYHFPHQQTLDTLKKERITVYDTASCGMITLNLIQEGRESSLSCYTLHR